MKRLVATALLSAFASAILVLFAMLVLGIGITQQTTFVGSTASSSAVSQNTPRTSEDIYKQAAPGVVGVAATGQAPLSPFSFPRRGEPEANGTGFVVDNTGRILTNAHVIDRAQKVTVTFANNGSRDATVVRKDDSNDTALLKIDPKGLALHPLPLGDSKSAQIGDPVLAIGNPLGLDRTLTSGVVSGLHRHLDAPNGAAINDAIQTSAALNPGNSGGPLLNAAGQVIGLNAQIATNSRSITQSSATGIGFAVPIESAKKLLS
jgi:S1-C subfamily serine protease